MNYNLTICGNNECKNLFLKHFLELKCNEDFERKKDDLYAINYKNVINKKEVKLKINLELVNEIDYFKYSSQCYIFLYDKNKI
jgi:hypothetical protein